ncbi:alpha/beta hydrolase fold domain-containing protein [Labrys okinawensis]|nr:alpha/beta hydrolase [Labrys okinawensis]
MPAAAEPSFASRSLHGLFRLLRVKDWARPPVLQALIRLSRSTGPALPSARLRNLCEIRQDIAHGDRVFHLGARDGGKAPFHLLYLHGGAYSFAISFLHWRFLENLIRRTGCSVTVPFYPLAPENGHRKVLASVLAHYTDLCARVAPERVVVMGDSAGGGLALALAQALVAAGQPQPGQLVLLSPWLDLTMDDPATLAHRPHDPVITPEAARAAARLYAGDLPLNDPAVSPLYGEMRGLAPIAIMTSTADLLNPEAHRLEQRLKAAGQPVELLEQAGMVHAWMLLPLPEAERARRQIGELLNARFRPESATA